MFGVVRVSVKSHHPSFASAYISLDPTKFRYKSLNSFCALFIWFLVTVSLSNATTTTTAPNKQIEFQAIVVNMLCRQILTTLFILIYKCNANLSVPIRRVFLSMMIVFIILFYSFLVSDNKIEREKQINHVRDVHAKWIKINNET